MVQSSLASLLEDSDVSVDCARRILAQALSKADDGELFLEHRRNSGLVFDDCKLKSAHFDERRGFGLRAVAGEAQAYGHSSDISEKALRNAADLCQTIGTANTETLMNAPAHTNQKFYGDQDPSTALIFAEQVKLLQEIDAHTRGLDPRISQVSLSLGFDWQAVEILRADGDVYRDIRPMMRFNISVVSTSGIRQGQGSAGFGGRGEVHHYLTQQAWRDAAALASQQSLVALEAIPAPAGEMDVVLGPGWPGVLLHEAVGHGLEGDFNRKKSSVFSDLMGERIASPDVTIVDNGTIPQGRGSLSIDDEGTPARSTTLIENGILVGLMQDRLNARLMKMLPTGNGRRQSYSHAPMPRMTNTYMLNGNQTPEEIIASMKKGIYAKSFGGGQVDITSGKFVFSCTEAYLIENGKIDRPIKGATLIGAGADALRRISMVGNDLALDPGIGTCGKAGQSVPAGVGQPTLRLDQITVGGTTY